MAQFTIQLDRRRKLKNDLYNLVVRVNVGNDNIYINIGKLTEIQFNKVFERKAGDEASIAYREKCEDLKTKCERVFNKVKPFDKARYRALLKEEDTGEEPLSLVIKDLFTDYFTNNPTLKYTSRNRYRTTMNVLESFQSGITVFEITPEFLSKFEKYKFDEGRSPATIASYMTDLRRILNYYTKVKKVIPREYEYPFSEGGYQIKNYLPTKFVIENEEIKSVVALNEFDSPSQEYARDIWLLLYRCNGSNFADLLRLRWSNMDYKHIKFYRKKTETTRKKNIKHITVPRTPLVNELLEKLGQKDSPFVLGLLKEGYSEKTFVNKSNKVRGEVNKHLKVITERLNSTYQLRVSDARDCYATTLNRAEKSLSKISDGMGHSSVAVTKNHYIGDMNSDEIFGLNDALF